MRKTRVILSMEHGDTENDTFRTENCQYQCMNNLMI